MRDDQAVNAELFEHSGLIAEQVISHVGIDLAVNREVKLARDTGGQNRAVAVDETQARPHRCASRPHDLPDWSRLFLDPISVFGRRIDTQIKALRIERRGAHQFLSKVVFGNAAIRWNRLIRREENYKRDDDWSPFSKFPVG